ncbi:GNAT family N-acetyltransferase [Lacticaseibacillus thailandensis]|uniref:GNAT family acetyltransferase protein n=1 Tax=Lacticaseibacillus thailandensis DSM 22698 = JCM 13996 TaxID=1423810 RepID=A0A0R2CKR7_9LACO|nr:GNAT family N-acetyltransferase [Lacticaseibacillus thailandensis]KRM88387.1 GNAT family acetyltransferase protein [Lacticaseibacillus thailandensis DSM 22698 = JCM 13996]
MQIRPATPADGVQAAPLIKVVFDEMEIPTIMAMTDAAVNAVFADAFRVGAYRYSYAHSLVAVTGDELVGICVGYPAAAEAHIDDAFAPFLPRVGITDGRDLFPDRESFPGEWYLDLLAVKSNARGCGVGTQLLRAAKQQRQQHGDQRIGLLCDLVNPRAAALYAREGFTEDGRVRLFDHEYRHMRQDLRSATVTVARTGQSGR